MKAFFILLCALCIGQSAALAQKGRTDSLRTVALRTSLPDSVRFGAMVQLAEIFSSSKPDSALFYASRITTYPQDSRAFLRLKSYAWNVSGMALYFKSQYDESIAAFRKYGEYARRLNDVNAAATAINNEGNIWLERGDIPTALQKYREVLLMQEGAKNDAGAAMAYTNIGYIYKDIGDYDKALSNFLYALRVYERTGRKRLAADVHMYLAVVYLRKKDWEQSVEEARKSYALHLEGENPNGQATARQMEANVYAEKGDLGPALQGYEDALAIYEKTGDTRQVIVTNSNIGEVWARKGEWQKSYDYYEKSIGGARRTGFRRNIATSFLGLANASISLGRLTEARVALDSAALLVNSTGSKEHRKNLYDVESKYFASLNRFDKALEYRTLYAAQKDSIINEVNVKTMSDMAVKYETEKKEARIALLGKEAALQALQLQNDQLQLDQQAFTLAQNRLRLTEADLEIARTSLVLANQDERILTQQLDSAQRERILQETRRRGELQALQLRNGTLELRQRNAIIAGLALLLLLGGALAWSYQRRTRLTAAARTAALLREQQEQATSAVLQAEEGERQRIAKDLHDGVGQLMSAAKMNLNAYRNDARFESEEQQQSFDRVIALIDESCSEVRTVSHNLMPNALLKRSLASAVREFVSQLDQRQLAVNLYTEGLDARLSPDTEAVLYRIIQECVNNVIKHARATTLDISILKDTEELTATIEDNGQGFDAGREGIADGIGLKNIRARVQYLKGSVEWDSAPGRGTLVAIHLPMA